LEKEEAALLQQSEQWQQKGVPSVACQLPCFCANTWSTDPAGNSPPAQSTASMFTKLTARTFACLPRLQMTFAISSQVIQMECVLLEDRLCFKDFSNLLTQ